MIISNSSYSDYRYNQHIDIATHLPVVAIPLANPNDSGDILGALEVFYNTIIIVGDIFEIHEWARIKRDNKSDGWRNTDTLLQDHILIYDSNQMTRLILIYFSIHNVIKNESFIKYKWK